jgi:hypothetical protein
MPSSSTHYSYNIPTVGSDSTTYGTLINQFVNSLSTKLKAVSDAINTAGVGASSTLAQINRNIAQVDAINSRLPAGVADLLPDPYSGATTPVSTWPYLNTELQAEGFSPPTTAQEVLDFDYEGFASYLNTRFDSLSARIVGLDAPITISDSSRLVCETNKILDALGTTKTVTTTVVSNLAQSSVFKSLYGVTTGPRSASFNNPYEPEAGPQENVIYSPDNKILKNLLIAEGLGTSSDIGPYSNARYQVSITAMDVTSKIQNGDSINAGIYIDTTYKNKTLNLIFTDLTPIGERDWFIRGDADPWYLNLADPVTSFGSTPHYVNGLQQVTLKFVKVTNSNSTTTTSSQVPVTIDDIDFSECS